MSACDAHPWALTAPWWRWPKLGTPSRNVRALPPALQMYDSSDPVKTFVKEPQKTLAYGADDVVKTLSAVTTAVGRLSRLSSRTLTSTTTRKVFLPIHKRFYLVVCELHCDTAGFPTVARDKVCEAGMVIRRRKLAVGNEHAAEAIEILKTIGAATAKLAAVDRSLEKRVLKKRSVAGAGAGGAAVAVPTKSKIDVALTQAAAAESARLEGELAVARAQLRDWQVASGATVLTEGWMASDFENVGSWQVVQDDPQGVSEVVYPLYPLIADPRNPAHDGAGKAIWFGMLPTGSREVEVNGAARFDEESRYEVRCFVRRHACDCPRTGEPNDCGGELVWSAASEVFQIAPHFDPAGTGNHPITIQMPDIPTLAASAPSLPVAMKFPAGSALGFKVDSKEGIKIDAPTTNKLPQICFFSIPLITIVATFVLHIFLPIVVLIFQLWFLLGLKFCILPSLQLQVGLDGQISADIQAQLDMSVSLDAAIDLAAGVNLDEALVANLNLNIGGDALATVNASHVVTPLPASNGSTGDVLRDTYATEVLQGLNDAITTDRKQEIDSRSVVSGLVFAPRVERVEVGA